LYFFILSAQINENFLLVLKVRVDFSQRALSKNFFGIYFWYQ
jgi:hypothetical protein